MPPRKQPADPALGVAYLRVSTDDQKLGSEVQRTQISEWAAAHGVTVVSWHHDEGVSGGAEIEKRPALLAALEAMKSHRAGRFLVAKRDRLARDSVNAGILDRWVERLGGRVFSADGTGNGDSPTDAVMRSITDAFATYERAVIRGRVKAALGAKRTKGERIGSVPWGMRLAADGVHLEVDEVEASVAQLARELRAEGRSYGQIVAALAGRGVVSRVGKPLSLTQIVRIVAPSPRRS